MVLTFQIGNLPSWSYLSLVSPVIRYNDVTYHNYGVLSNTTYS